MEAILIVLGKENSRIVSYPVHSDIRGFFVSTLRFHRQLGCHQVPAEIRSKFTVQIDENRRIRKRGQREQLHDTVLDALYVSLIMSQDPADVREQDTELNSFHLV